MSQDQLDTRLFGEPPPPEARRGRRRRRSHGRLRRAVILLVAVVLVGGGGVLAYPVVRSLPVMSFIGGSSNEAKDFPGPGSGAVAIVVKPGQSGEAIATTLRDAGVVASRTAYLQAVTSDPEDAAKIQPGTYTLKREMKASDAFALLADPANRAPSAAIPEGLWKSEVFTRLSKATGQPVSAYEAATKDPAALGLPEVAKGNVEGYLFPSSYDFNRSTPAAKQLSTMIARTVAELKQEGVEPADYQRTLTVASIVEGEVSQPDDRGKVARVIENRLGGAKNGTTGRLEMDSTVHYAAQQRGKAGTSDKQRASQSPYNTYVRAGLPPGPINSPGAAAIAAAVQPTPGPWFYFVTVNPSTGETKFAATDAEHDRNAEEFRAWCRANSGKC